LFLNFEELLERIRDIRSSEKELKKPGNNLKKWKKNNSTFEPAIKISFTNRQKG
jgi:hypothetical protein